MGIFFAGLFAGLVVGFVGGTLFWNKNGENIKDKADKISNDLH